MLLPDCAHALRMSARPTAIRARLCMRLGPPYATEQSDAIVLPGPWCGYRGYGIRQSLAARKVRGRRGSSQAGRGTPPRRHDFDSRSRSRTRSAAGRERAPLSLAASYDAIGTAIARLSPMPWRPTQRPEACELLDRAKHHTCFQIRPRSVDDRSPLSLQATIPFHVCSYAFR